ncbi:MAG: RIP metalloprotease RseP [Spirochaetes bacterium GWF1_51_8]|nr:MAG: RIP metalloprotease RseP [Spirochaetes bacterium GWF1_51_8]
MDILGIVIAILVLGVLVTVHELGHFIMAKISGIGVDTFSIGFGKELVSWKWGETKFRLALIPLGGYCKMRGEETKDRGPGDPKKKEETPEAPAVKDPKAMYNRPPWARILAILGGSFFNYFFAILVFFCLFLFGYKEEVIVPKVAVVQQTADGELTPAFKAGLTNGDVILTINGKTTGQYTDIMQTVMLGAKEELVIVYLRGDVTNTTKVTPILSEQSGAGFIGIEPYTDPAEPVIGKLLEKRPAIAAGLKEGDRILAVNGIEVKLYEDLTKEIKANPNKEVVFKIQRGEEVFEKTIKLDSIMLTNKFGTNLIIEEAGLLGIYPLVKYETTEKEVRADNIFHAFAMGFMEANNSLVKVWDGLVVMFKGKIDVQKNISGPLRIIKLTSDIATKTTFVKLMQFMAMIAVALAFFNLLPLPGLDGGTFLINLFEMVTKIKPSEKVLTVIEYIGLFFIISLAAIVFINDIVNLLRGA